MNMWGNGTCLEVATNGTERWRAEMESDCCPAGIWLGATPREVYICIFWFLILCWIFLGVAMGADVFMTSIEVITSKESVKQVTGPDGSKKKFHTRVWNATVANLTLMALGSSAPEILLNVMEVLVGGMNSGELGPSTIVGSAAFNLMVITAVCLVCLPEGETRTIKQLGVFLCTAFFSVVAYIWLYVIVVSSSPEVIEVWEAVMTVVFMVLLIIFAFAADKYWDKISTMTRTTGVSGAGLSKADAAIALKDAQVSKGATSKEIKDALQETMPPKTRAHYRKQAMANSVGTATTNKKKTTQVMPSDDLDADGKKARMQEAANAANYTNEAGTIKWKQHMYDVMESGGSVTVEAERVGGSKGEVTVQYKTKNQKAVAGKDFEAVDGTWTWADGDTSVKNVSINIIDDDEFEKDEEFTIVLSEPTGGAVFPADTDGGADEDVATINILNDDDRATKLVEAIRMLRLDADSLDLAGDDYMEQLKEIFIPPSTKPKEFIMHVLTVPWKLLFGIMPPPGFCGGWPCFVGSLVGIGLQVILISDFATQMGCQMYIKDTVTAITFVALGTSLPDTFASMSAARGDKYADNSIGNVTGSNSVNVFFGLGLPWLIGSVYWAAAGGNSAWIARYHYDYGEAPLPVDLYNKWVGTGAFVVRKGDLGFSVIVFTVCAIITISMILIRRKMGNQELGGNKTGAMACAALLCFLWMMYVTLSTLTTYHIIEPGI